MVATAPLSSGSIVEFMVGTEFREPVVQVLNVKRVDGQQTPQANSPDRYRLILSDGIHYVQAMLLVPLNDLCVNNILTKFTIIRLKYYLVNDVVGRGRKIVIVGELEIVSQATEKIGDPVQYTEAAATNQMTTTPRPSVNAPHPGSYGNTSVGNTAGVNPQNNYQRGAVATPYQQQQQKQPPPPQQHQQQYQQHQPYQQQQQQQQMRLAPLNEGYNQNMNMNQYGQSNMGVSAQAAAGRPAGRGQVRQSGYNQTYPSGGFSGMSDMNGSAQSRGQTTTIFPISSLSPYANKWTIKVRVQSKGEIRVYHSQKGEGKVFNCILIDDSGEIQATTWKEQCDQLHSLLHEGNVYLISRGIIQVKGKFNNTKNEYELVFDKSTTIESCEDNADIPIVNMTATPLADLAQVKKDEMADVLAIVRTVHDLQSFVAKTTNRSMTKRTLDIVDQSMYTVSLTLWGKVAENFNSGEGTAIVAKNAKVSDFGGRSLSLLNSSTLMINPDIPAAHHLLGWYNHEGRTAQYTAYQNGMGVDGGFNAGSKRDEVKTLAQVKDEQLGMCDKPDYYTCKATVTNIKQENMSYPACPNPGCNKKVVSENGQWRCEKCQMSHPEPDYRYILTVSALDATSQVWLQCFNEVGAIIIGKTAMEMQQLKDMDLAAFNAVMHDANFKTYKFRVRTKQQNYNDELRTRHNVLEAIPLTDTSNIVAFTNKLLDTIKMYQGL